MTRPGSRPLTGWMDDAACSGHTDLGWLKEPEDVPFGEELTMVGICARCPVHIDCEEFATAFEVTVGFWAGRHRTPDGPLLPVRMSGDAA